MQDEDSVRSGRVQLAPGLVGDRDFAQVATGFQARPLCLSRLARNSDANFRRPGGSPGRQAPVTGAPIMTVFSSGAFGRSEA